jgi:hypothetical protein
MSLRQVGVAATSHHVVAGEPEFPATGIDELLDRGCLQSSQLPRKLCHLAHDPYSATR